MNTTTNIHGATSLIITTGSKLASTATYISRLVVRTDDGSTVEITLFHDEALPITTINGEKD